MQTPHYHSDAAKLEAVQRRAVRTMWGLWSKGGLAQALVAGGGEQSRPRLRHLTQPGPAGNLRNTESVLQHLEKDLPSKGRNELAGKTEGRGFLPSMGQVTQAQASTKPSHQPSNGIPPVPTSAATSVSQEIPLPWSGKQREEAGFLL